MSIKFPDDQEVEAHIAELDAQVQQTPLPWEKSEKKKLLKPHIILGTPYKLNKNGDSYAGVALSKSPKIFNIATKEQFVDWYIQSEHAKMIRELLPGEQGEFWFSRKEFSKRI